MQKIILITGARKGIGKFLAQHYLKQGHMVCACSRKESAISHENYRHFMLDVSDEMAVVSMLRKIRKEFGGVDVLIIMLV